MAGIIILFSKQYYELLQLKELHFLTHMKNIEISEITKFVR